jgi:hypothetical protein
MSFNFPTINRGRNYRIEETFHLKLRNPCPYRMDKALIIAMGCSNNQG